MITFACVLKSGGEYTLDMVDRLRRGIDKHCTVAHRFVFLSDLPGGIPLKHNWKGWWSKIELFRSELFRGQVVFFDLDTIIVGSLDWLNDEPIKFAMLENFWSNERIGSGMMAWNTDMIDLSSIYGRFLYDPKKFMAEGVTQENWGDQGFIRHNWPQEPKRFQREYPGKVVSYKFHVRPESKVPAGASVVCFHGQPRPWQTSMWGKF